RFFRAQCGTEPRPPLATRCDVRLFGSEVNRSQIQARWVEHKLPHRLRSRLADIHVSASVDGNVLRSEELVRNKPLDRPVLGASNVQPGRHIRKSLFALALTEPSQ